MNKKLLVTLYSFGTLIILIATTLSLVDFVNDQYTFVFARVALFLIGATLFIIGGIYSAKHINK